MGSGPGSPFGLRTKPPEPPGCLTLEDLQTLCIHTNKKLEVWTQYRLLLSFLGGYFSSFKKILRQREDKSWEITGLIKWMKLLGENPIQCFLLIYSYWVTPLLLHGDPLVSEELSSLLHSSGQRYTSIWPLVLFNQIWILCKKEKYTTGIFLISFFFLTSSKNQNTFITQWPFVQFPDHKLKWHHSNFEISLTLIPTDMCTSENQDGFWKSRKWPYLKVAILVFQYTLVYINNEPYCPKQTGPFKLICLRWFVLTNSRGTRQWDALY